MFVRISGNTILRRMSEIGHLPSSHIVKTNALSQRGGSMMKPTHGLAQQHLEIRLNPAMGVTFHEHPIRSSGHADALIDRHLQSQFRRRIGAR